MWAPRILASVALTIPTIASPLNPPAPQSVEELREGHWVKLKGDAGTGRTFTVSAVEVLRPDRKEELVGTVGNVDADGERFWMMEQEVHVSDKTEWDGVDLRSLAGQRVKVEGYYRGAKNFSAREVSAYGDGRDRLVGRLDEIELIGGRYVGRVMDYELTIPRGVELESEAPLGKIELAPARILNSNQVRPIDPETFIPNSVRLTDTLSLGALLEMKTEREDNYDLNDDRARDEVKSRVSVTTQLAWTPTEDFLLLGRGRVQGRNDYEQESPRVEALDTTLNELFAYWRPSFAPGFELQVGRQDFDERREWLYDENLDGVRLIYNRPRLRAELSASTLLAGGSERNENTDNLMLYVSNNDRNRHLAAYVIDRRDDSGPKDYPIHFGARAYGEWFPRNKMWAEASLLRGYTDTVDLRSYAFDVGTTWFPEFAEPLNFTIGWAFGSGDPDPADGVDRTFRQTGLHDNNDRFGGVTSFRYYGEIFDPDLSNLSILTLGVGARFSRRTSLDLVLHKYDQDVATAALPPSNLRRQPDGSHTDLGWEADLILGARVWEGWDFELVLGTFQPGDALPGADAALHGAFQVRYRF